jgi:hypothetical protein
MTSGGALSKPLPLSFSLTSSHGNRSRQLLHWLKRGRGTCELLYRNVHIFAKLLSREGGGLDVRLFLPLETCAAFALRVCVLRRRSCYNA